MKKNIIIYLIIVFVTSACKPDYSLLNYQGDAFVSFPKLEDATFEALGGVPKTIKITVNRATENLSAPVTVTFTSSAKYSNGPNVGNPAPNTYTLMGDSGSANSLVIPAGKASAEITLTSVDNAVLDGYKEVAITLLSAGDLKIGYPGPTQANKSIIVTLFDDEDTTFNLLKFLGNYTCNTGLDTYDMRFTRSSLGGNATVSSKFQNGDLGDIGVIYILDPITSSVIIPQQEFPASDDPNTQQTRRWVIDNGGTDGIFDVVTGNMQVPTRLRRKNLPNLAFPTQSFSNIRTRAETFTRK